MSENHKDCQHFEELLHDGAAGVDLDTWQPHLEQCAGCRQQWSTHQMLVATFAELAVPELSPGFDSRLQRKIATAVEIKPLEGWRLAAMLGYALLTVALLRWAFVRFPLPAISIDPASPWILISAIVAVPLTLWLAVGVTRWLPPMGKRGLPHLSLL